MEQGKHNQATIFVIFGAGGDLTWRKLIPALHNLYLDGQLPEQMAVLGLGRKPLSDQEFQSNLRAGVERFSRRGKPENSAWEVIAPVLESWTQVPAGDFPDYRPGSWGPEAAAAQIHVMSCAEQPEVAARAYQKLLLDFFHPDPPRFDLILLGLGEDGHTASLFPGTPGLQQKEQLVILGQKPGEDFARLSLSLPLINLARMLVFLVSGPKKTRIFKAIQQGPAARYPAQFIAPQEGEILWLVDRDAAGEGIDPDPA
jgi:hypothetical protein